MNISISQLPLATGWRDPQLRSNEWRAAFGSVDEQFKAIIRVEWNVGGGRRHMCSGMQECTMLMTACDWLWLWSHHSFEWWVLWGITGFSRSVTLDSPCYSHDLRHAHGASSCALDSCILVHAPYSFHKFYCELCPSHALCDPASWSHSSDLSNDELLPAATETGHLWPFKELIFSYLLNNESGSMLGLPGLIFE